MSVTLSPEVEARVLRWVEDRGYPDPMAVVDEALQLLEARDQEYDDLGISDDRLRALLAEGEASIARGDVIEWTPELLPRLRREAHEAALRGDPIPDHVKP